MKQLSILIAVVIVSDLNAQAPKAYIDSLNKLRVNSEMKPTTYKPGFTYTMKQPYPMTATLIKYIKVGKSFFGWDEYRWRVKINFLGIEGFCWTDDCWIDVDLGKAYLDTTEHKIKYYQK